LVNCSLFLSIVHLANYKDIIDGLILLVFLKSSGTIQFFNSKDQSSSMFEGPDIFLVLFIYPVEQQPGFYHLLYRTNIEIRKSDVQSNEWFI
jgi:hypothetical protein